MMPAAAVGRAGSSSRQWIFTSRENQAQGILGLAFKNQDSESSEHFTKSDWNKATVEFIVLNDTLKAQNVV